jgi:hypothetical protein
MISITKVTVKDMGSCSCCRQGVSVKGPPGLTYPYKYVYEIRIGQPDFSQSIRLCSECLEELRETIK